MRSNTARLQRALALLFLVVVAGTAWYALVEGFPWLDALYMTVITVTTVGYREVQPLDTSGLLFTIVFLLVGVGLAFYTVVALVEAVIVGEVAAALGLRRQSRKVRGLDGHHVLCGFGRVGQSIARELHSRRMQFVIIDRDPERQIQAHDLGYLMVQGDATEESVLREAGVERARVLIAAADSDAGNTFVTLTARALNPALTIIARAASDSGARRMLAAGANNVISPYQIAGHRMALAAFDHARQHAAIAADPAAAEATACLVELVTTSESVGHSLASALGDLVSVHVLAVRHSDGTLLSAPPLEYVLVAGDRLMLYGTQEDIDALCAEQGLDAIIGAMQPRALRSSLSSG
ncbi:MAG: potassium channel family protein [Dehalococcoidia bacterium]